jgi:hypothetical protein
MPPLTDLTQRIEADANWNREYQAALPETQRVAQTIHLVHVTGVRENQPREQCIAFERLLLEEPHEIPTSSNPLYCSDATRLAEDILGLGRSSYFFVGRACLDFGDVALAFTPKCEEGHTGSATPFDTGGLINGRIQGNLPDPGNARCDFGSSATIQLSLWRTAFGHYLAAYFSTPLDYWTARQPSRVDPEGIYRHPDNTFRAWTFEVRFSEGHSIYNNLAAWSARETFITELRRILDATPLSDPAGEQSPIERFLAIAPNITPKGDPDFCGSMERWIRSTLSIV